MESEQHGAQRDRGLKRTFSDTSSMGSLETTVGGWLQSLDRAARAGPNEEVDDVSGDTGELARRSEYSV